MGVVFLPRELRLASSGCSCPCPARGIKEKEGGVGANELLSVRSVLAVVFLTKLLLAWLLVLLFLPFCLAPASCCCWFLVLFLPLLG